MGFTLLFIIAIFAFVVYDNSLSKEKRLKEDYRKLQEEYWKLNNSR